jgi:hypothetical protein
MKYTRKSDLGPDKQRKFDHINQMIKLSVITLSGFHSIYLFVTEYYKFTSLVRSETCFVEQIKYLVNVTVPLL